MNAGQLVRDILTQAILDELVDMCETRPALTPEEFTSSDLINCANLVADYVRGEHMLDEVWELTPEAWEAENAK